MRRQKTIWRKQSLSICLPGTDITERSCPLNKAPERPLRQSRKPPCDLRLYNQRFASADSMNRGSETAFPSAAGNPWLGKQKQLSIPGWWNPWMQDPQICRAENNLRETGLGSSDPFLFKDQLYT